MADCQIILEDSSSEIIKNVTWSLPRLDELARLHQGKVIKITGKTPELTVLWECNEGDRWEQKVSTIQNGAWCPICFRRSQIRKGKGSISTSKTVKIPAIFEGGKGELFAFDMNNLATCWRKRFPREDIFFSDFADRISKCFPGANSKYLSFFFASNHYRYLVNKFPTNTHNRWFIERYQKNGINRQCMDIDSTLTGRISPLIQLYRDQITHFYLGSGDLDLHYVVDLARKHKIPVTIVAFDDNSLNSHLARLGDYVKMLY
jgi:hypothetical protein